MKKINKITNIPEIEYVNLKVFKENKRVLLFTGPTAYKSSKSFLKGLNIVEVFHIDSSKKEIINKNIDFLISKKSKVDICFAVGGGIVADVAKMYAHELNLSLVIIPTLISSDAFLVDCTGIRYNGCVKYIPSLRAKSVLIDFNLLKKTPLRLHLSGCGDVLSIYTGLSDWKLANRKEKLKADETYSVSVAKMAETILEGLLIEKDEIKKGTRKGLEAILRALIMEVQLCNTYGNSRPEEGGEHFFTYCIENYMPHFLHGEMVSFGVLITSYLQKETWRKMYNFLTYVGLNYIPKGLTEELVMKTLKELPSYVKKHHLRYSVYNDFSLKKDGVKVRKFVKFILGKK
ncbi:iron-containing alcohol dehydrogenase [Candidatus Roizmanbacteria bacterium]|nr:iron-containing alcohol dehydrogenase [Candidatus Roizmanbacteria bacterium]